MDVLAAATGRCSVASLQKRLKAVRKIPVYPETKSSKSVVGGAGEDVFMSIEMLAEDEGMVCFLSEADKKAEVRRLSKLLKIRMAESESK